MVISGCIEPQQTEVNNFADNQLVNIYDLQDQRNSEKLIPFLKAKKEHHRVAAALAFASIKDTLAIPYLSQIIQIDQDELPRRAAAFALGQIGHSKALKVLRSSFDSELSKTNQRYILEAIGKCGDSSTITLFEKTNYQDSTLKLGWAYGVFRLSLKRLTSNTLTKRMLALLESENSLLEQELASHFITRHYRLTSQPAGSLTEKLKKIAQSTTNQSLKDRLNSTLLYVAPIREQFSWNWTKTYKNLGDYDKVKALEKLEIKHPKLIDFCYAIATDSSHSLAVKTAAFQKFVDAQNQLNTDQLGHKKMEDALKFALKSNNMALQSIAAIELQNEKYLASTDIWLPILSKTKKKITLPQQAETYIDVCRAIEAQGGAKFNGYKPAFNHPINWEYVKTIPHNEQVIIETTKGNIILQLFVNEAPGTVSNFLHLVDSNFYNNKFFHRVVPLFVIQGGCPRGDGWGGLNWTQRSEFSNYQTYKPGTFGIASSGQDTEGVQFFITHCHTPHLDGRYTIFARIIDGMSVVNSIDVGDRIISIKRNPTKIEIGEDS